METKAGEQQEAHEIVRWRRERLGEAGFLLPLATRIANDSAYDLHALIELVERGCPTELAARILAPLRQEPNAA